MRTSLCAVMHLIMVLAMVLTLSCQTEVPAPLAPAPDDLASLEQCRPGGVPHGVIPPHARPHGKSYGKWSELWWQWMASAPALPEVNPVLDHTGAVVDYGQAGGVWFIAPSVEPGVVREATIPPGKMLFVALAAFEASTWEGLGVTEEELRASAAAVVDLIEIDRFSVDGREIPIGPEFRIPSAGMFSLTVPDENVFDWWGFPAPAGTYYPSVADGYYVMLTPLPVGNHTLVIHWSMLDLVAELTLHLRVSPH